MTAGNVVNITDRLYRRQRIKIVPRQLADAVTAAEIALIKADAGIYQRDGKLVRIVQPAVGAGSPYIRQVTGQYLMRVLSKCVIFQKYDGRIRDWKIIDPPQAVISRLLALPAKQKCSRPDTDGNAA